MKNLDNLTYKELEATFGTARPSLTQMMDYSLAWAEYEGLLDSRFLKPKYETWQDWEQEHRGRRP